MHGDVEGHGTFSDERLKRAIATVENALAELRAIDSDDDGPDVQAHQMHSDDEQVEQAIVTVENTLAALRAIGSADG
jgi:hypothetical protein